MNDVLVQSGHQRQALQTTSILLHGLHQRFDTLSDVPSDHPDLLENLRTTDTDHSTEMHPLEQNLNRVSMSKHKFRQNPDKLITHLEGRVRGEDLLAEEMHMSNPETIYSCASFSQHRAG